jgi:hypothetical protein
MPFIPRTISDEPERPLPLEGVTQMTGMSIERMQAGLRVVAGIMVVFGLLLLSHESKYPSVWRYSSLYFGGLIVFFAVVITLVAVAQFAPRSATRLLNRRPIQRALLFSAALVVTLLMAEGILALVPDRYWRANAVPDDGPIFARQEPPLHHIRPANSHHVVVSSFGEFRVDVRINSDNLRDVERPVAKPSEVTRIAVLGDSMVEGIQVPLEETFAKRLEGLLLLETGRKHDVINAGISSNSATAEYLLLKHKIVKYRPDVVILAFFPADVSDDDKYRIDFIFDSSGVPVTRAPRAESVSRSIFWPLVAYSRVLRFFVENVMTLEESQASDLAVSVMRTDYTARELQAWNLTKTAIRATRDLAVSHGARFVLLALPYPIQVSPEEGGVSASRMPPALGSSTQPQQVLWQFARDEGIVYLDVLPTLRESRTARLYFAHDQHLTSWGHQVIAKALASFLLESHLVWRREQ